MGPIACMDVLGEKNQTLNSTGKRNQDRPAFSLITTQAGAHYMLPE